MARRRTQSSGQPAATEQSEPLTGPPTSSRSVSKLQRCYTHAASQIGCTLVTLVLAIMLFVFSLQWQHVFGAFLAALLLLMHVAEYFGQRGRHAPCPSHRLLTVALCSARRKKIRRVTKFCSVLVYVSTFTLAILLAAVHLLGPDQIYTSFPQRCTGLEHCARIAETNAHGAGDLSVPTLPTSAMGAYRDIRAFVLDLPRTALLYEHVAPNGNVGYLQARTVSGFFGFPDDTFVRVQCDGANATVELQGEARIGRKDFGINLRRLQRVLRYIDATHFPRERCA